MIPINDHVEHHLLLVYFTMSASKPDWFVVWWYAFIDGNHKTHWYFLHWKHARHYNRWNGKSWSTCQ